MSTSHMSHLKLHTPFQNFLSIPIIQFVYHTKKKLNSPLYFSIKSSLKNNYFPPGVVGLSSLLQENWLLVFFGRIFCPYLDANSFASATTLFVHSSDRKFWRKLLVLGKRSIVLDIFWSSTLIRLILYKIWCPASKQQINLKLVNPFIIPTAVIRAKAPLLYV